MESFFFEAGDQAPVGVGYRGIDQRQFNIESQRLVARLDFLRWEGVRSILDQRLGLGTER